jgi:hypothetical protein
VRRIFIARRLRHKFSAAHWLKALKRGVFYRTPAEKRQRESAVTLKRPPSACPFSNEIELFICNSHSTRDKRNKKKKIKRFAAETAKRFIFFYRQKAGNSTRQTGIFTRHTARKMKNGWRTADS